MQYIDPIKSAASLTRGGGTVEAAAHLHKVAGTVAAARNMRLDSAGGMGYLGLRHALQCAAKAYVGVEDTKRIDAALATVMKARVDAPEGRLDDKSINLSGSDRIDSANPSATLALARELEFVYSDVLREERPARSAKRLFDVDTRVPAGAKTHTIRRFEGSGEAKFWRNGMEVPLVGIGRDEETFNVKHAVIGLELDFFSNQASAFAGIGEYGEKVSETIDAMEEFENILFWQGSVQNKLLGVATYPWLPKRVIAEAFGAITTLAQFEADVAALHDMVNEVLDRNPGMINGPLRFITSPRFHRGLAQNSKPETDLTLEQRFLNGQPQISSIEDAPELQNYGGTGVDAVLILPDGPKAPKLVTPTPFTMMPLQSSNYGFTTSQAAYASFGGVVMRDVLRTSRIEVTVNY